jgi:uncharacterized protein YmfQ (DUF2313 family)
MPPLDSPADTWVQRTAPEYAQAFNGLLPTGPAWPRDPERVIQKVIAGLSGIWGDPFETLAALLLTQESDPRSTVILLSDWERAFGLPDPCVAEPLTLTARQAALVAKMTMLGGQSRAFFIALAIALGYSITITEYSPFICGVSRCGDSSGIFNPEDPTRQRWQLGPPEIRYYWTVHVGALRLTYFRAGQSQAGDRLLTIALATDLECVIRRYAPAHTIVLFDYSQVASLNFAQAFNSGYLAIGIP